MTITLPFAVEQYCHVLLAGRMTGAVFQTQLETYTSHPRSRPVGGPPEEDNVAYDERLAERTRQVLLDLQPTRLDEKKMFGGVGFMVQGNMACGVHKDKLVVRVGPERYLEALAMPHTVPFDMTGRAMKGWVMVEAHGCASDDDLKGWVQQGVSFAGSLPAK